MDNSTTELQTSDSNAFEYIDNRPAFKKRHPLRIRVAASALEKADVLELRRSIYVNEQGRLADVNDIGDTFDKYNDSATYFIAYDGARPVGTVKVTADSAHGLPSDATADLSALRSVGKLAEFGHLLCVREHRAQRFGIDLMRHALVYSVRELQVTHVIGDFFIDRGASHGLHEFYRMIGFVPLAEPYRDTRFASSPLSVVAVLDIQHALALLPVSTGRQRKLLEFFFGDHHEHAAVALTCARDNFERVDART